MSTPADEAAAREDESAQRLADLAGEIVQLEDIARAWPPEQRAVAERIKAAIEALHREALLRLVRGLRGEAASAAKLAELARDPLIFGVLRLHGIVRDPLETRVRAALSQCAPYLAQHGGGVELIAIEPPDTVKVRLTGACQTCPAAGQTLREGVERAIGEHAPEITRIVPVRGSLADGAAAAPLHFVSPFAHEADAGFIDVCALDELPFGGITLRKLGEREVLLYRERDQVCCYDNLCAHMGLPLDDGPVEDGILVCPRHGFAYRLDTGQCLSVPEVQLLAHAVRVRDGRVAVKLAA